MMRTEKSIGISNAPFHDSSLYPPTGERLSKRQHGESAPSSHPRRQFPRPARLNFTPSQRLPLNPPFRADRHLAALPGRNVLETRASIRLLNVNCVFDETATPSEQIAIHVASFSSLRLRPHAQFVRPRHARCRQIWRCGS